MIVDVHTHIMWYPEHVSEQWAQEALASKLVKLKYSGGLAHTSTLDLHSYDATEADHWKAAQQADKVVVFGLQAKAAGAWVPNELIAAYAAKHPEKIIGWASVDPNEPDCVEQLEYAVNTLKLTGLKLGPAYQHFDPTDHKHWPFFAAVQRLGIPIIWHQGTTFPSRAKIRWASPLMLEDISMDFPDIRMIVAHLGHPWEEDVVALIRKAPNMYADISAVHYRPWRYWQAMVTAMEYGVSHKLLLASDFPSATIDNVIAGLRNVNAPVEGTKLPQIPKEIQDRIISENWREAFPRVGLTIESVSAVPVRAPRTKPMISAGGYAPLRVSDFGIVRIRTSDGIEGLGEISMNNGRDGAIQCDDVTRLLGPALVGQSPLDVRRHIVAMDRVMDGSEPAKAAVEMALWDIVGKVRGVPVYELFGGQVHDSVFIRWGLAFGDPGAGVEEIAPWIAKGVRTIKVKIGRPGTGLDEQMVKAVRDAVGDSINVMVDANSGYRTSLIAVQELERLEPYRLQLVEQPIHRKRLAELAFIRGHISTPILADESMRHWPDAYDVARAGAADALGIYICEAGGMLAALNAAAIGEAAGLVVTIGSQCELGIGTAAMAHAAVCMPNLAFESDITGHLRYPVDIINEQLDYRDGAIHPPTTPGLGVTLNEEVLERWRLDR